MALPARIPTFRIPLLRVNLELLKELEECLAEITGLPGVTLQPAAGAQGEMTGLMIIQALPRIARQSPKARADTGLRARNQSCQRSDLWIRGSDP
jgi:hypothetical protein